MLGHAECALEDSDSGVLRIVTHCNIRKDIECWNPTTSFYVFCVLNIQVWFGGRALQLPSSILDVCVQPFERSSVRSSRSNVLASVRY